MPFAHLKECPLDYNTPWRPAVVEMAKSTRDLLSDTLHCRNSVQHYEPTEKPVKPQGYEVTVREAIRSGNWPSRHEAVQASLCTSGWKEFKTIRASQMASKRGGAPSPAMKKMAGDNDALADLLGVGKSSPSQQFKFPANLAKQSGAPGLKTFKEVPGSDMATAAPPRVTPGLPASLSASRLDDEWTPSSPVHVQLPAEIAAGGTIGSRGFKEFVSRGKYTPQISDAQGRLKGNLKGHFGGQTSWSKEKGLSEMWSSQ